MKYFQLKKKFVLIFVCLFVLASVSNAQTIDLFVTQLDEIQNSERDNVIIFQNGIMDYLFDVGYIVSSENINLNTDIEKAKNVAMKAAKTGFVEYLVSVEVNVDSISDEITFVNWLVESVNDEKVLGKGTEKARGNQKKKESYMLKFGNEIGKKINFAIKNNKF